MKKMVKSFLCYLLVLIFVDLSRSDCVDDGGGHSCGVPYCSNSVQSFHNCPLSCELCPVISYINASQDQAENTTWLEQNLIPGDFVALRDVVTQTGYVTSIITISLQQHLPVLVAWIHLDYQTTWVNFTDITLKQTCNRTKIVPLSYCHYKAEAESYIALYGTAIKTYLLQIGLTFMLRVNTAGLWIGDMVVYLGRVSDVSLRLWSYRRRETLVVVINEQELVVEGFLNPALYEYVDEEGKLVGHYRFPLGRFRLQHQTWMLAGQSPSTQLDTVPVICGTSYFTYNFLQDQRAGGDTYSSASYQQTLSHTTSGFRYFSYKVDKSIASVTYYFELGGWVSVMETATHFTELLVLPSAVNYTTEGYLFLNTTARVRFNATIDPPVFWAIAGQNFTSVTCGNITSLNQTIPDPYCANHTVVDTARYSEVGLHFLYTVSWNKLSLAMHRIFVIVAQVYPIKNLTLIANRTQVSSSQYKDVDITLSIGGGSDFYCTSNMLDAYGQPWNLLSSSFTSLQDLSVNVTVDSPSTTSFSLTGLEAGDYEISITCLNAVSNVTHTIPVAVVVKIVDLTSSMSKTEYFLTNTMVIDWTITEGSGVTVEVFFNDTLCFNTSVSGYLSSYSSIANCSLEDTSLFTYGRTQLDLIVSNAASTSNTTTFIDIYPTLDNLTLTVKTTNPALASNPEGSGSEGDQYPVEFPILFESFYLNGPPSTVLWEVTCATNSFTSTNSSFEFQFDFVIPEMCDVTLTMTTPLQTVSVNKTIYVQPMFSLESVTTNDPVKINTTMLININLGNFGVGTCMWVDLGDNSSLHVIQNADRPCNGTFDVSEINPNIVSEPTIIYQDSEPTNKRITFVHLYPEIRLYNMRVFAFDLFSNKSYELINVVVDLFCKHPNVTILGLPPESSYPIEASRHNRSFTLELSTGNEILCEKTELTRTVWSVFKFDVDPRIVLKPAELLPRTEYQCGDDVMLITDVLSIPGRTLTYGFYAIVARLEMKGFPYIYGVDTYYIHIVQTPWIEAALTKGPFVPVVFRELAIINASASIDPDFDGIDGMTFTWFCGDVDDIDFFRANMSDEALIYIPTLKDFETIEPPALNSSGCFGTNRGRLNSTSAALELETINMVEGKSFNIKLLVAKNHSEFGIRESLYDVYFVVLAGLPPALEIRCIKNCQKKVLADQKMILEAQCTARCYGELQFTWSLFIYDHYTMREPRNLSASLPQISKAALRKMVSNPIEELSMAYKPHSLLPHTKYVLQLVAMRPIGVFGELRYTMRVNEAPSEGECVVSPLRGIAMQTDFQISCSNWVDNDSPLTYEYSAINSGGMSTVFFYGQNSSGASMSANSWLPIGDPDNDYEVNMNVKIKDKFSAGALVNLSVKVDPPDKETVNTTKLKQTVAVRLHQLLNISDSQGVLRLCFILSSVLNHINKPQDNSSINQTMQDIELDLKLKEDSDAIRLSCLMALGNISINNMQALLQTAGVLASLSDVKEPPVENEELTVTLTESMTVILFQQSDSDAIFTDVVQGALNLANIAGKTMAAISLQSKSSNGTSESSNATGLTELTLRCLNLTNQLQSVMAENMVPNEGPLTVDTADLSIQVEKVTVSNFGSAPNNLRNSQFVVPTADALGLGEILGDVNATISQLQSIGMKMAAFGNNPFTWDNTSETVKSNVISLDISSNQNITTSNLTKEIALTIARDPSEIQTYSFSMKPGPDDATSNVSTLLKYHCFSRSSQWTAMNLEFNPDDVSITLRLYLKTAGRPNLKTKDYDIMYTLPDFSSCTPEETGNETLPENETIVIDPFKHCKVHPYTAFISNTVFNQTGEHCFVVEHLRAKTNDDEDPTSSSSRRKRSFSCEIGKRRMRRSCVIIPPPPPTPPPQSPLKVLVADNLGFDGKYFFPNQTPNYNLSMFESSCLYWDEENQTWAGHGCRVGPLTSRDSIQCFCNHLTSFASDLVVAPNPIDFSSVFANFGSLQDNVAVLALISSVLGLYIIGVLWSRRADKRDLLMLGPTILPNPQGSYHYLITLHTGNRQQSGTSAKVFFKMSGDQDETIPVKLWDRQRPCFERGQENAFLVSYPNAVGELTYIQIWHNNGGLSPSWYLSRLSIKDLQTDQQWYFVCDNWLAVESEDGKVCRVLPVANEQELTSFNQLFTARTLKGLADGHLWFSIFSRPPNSNFTRVQRLSCCLCLLCCTMITSAMFYNMGGDGPSPFAIHIGSLVIDLKQFVIGLESSIIIIPVNVALVQIFRNLRPKESKEDKDKDKESNDVEEIENTKTRQETEDGNKKTEEEKSSKGKLPHWFSYIAYALCYLTSAACIFFTLLYSIQWGETKSTEWVIAMVTAFLQSVILLQPVKVVVMAVVFAVLIRKPCDSDEEKSQVIAYEPPPETTKKKERRKSHTVKIYSPPDPKTLIPARIKRLKEIQMNAILKEIAAFFVFLLMLLNVAYYHRNPNTYLMTKTLYETFDEVDAYGVDLAAIYDGDSLWMWARETLVPGLYATEWYNGKKIEKGYIANMEDYLVGVPRIRLLRIGEDSCSVGKYFKDTIPHCYSSYSLINEEKRTFDVGWQPLASGSARKRRNVQEPRTEKEWLELMGGGSETKINVRQKRALDPIMSSRSGKNRRKKKRLLASDKPKTYRINDRALLPSGKVQSCLERWRHQSTLDLRGFPYWGSIALYSGSGYVANLGYDSVTAYTVISDLHSNGWIDVQTRAVFVEFTVYNANTNLFGIVSLFIEFPSSSAAVTRAQYQAARFYLHLTFGQTLSHVMVIFFMMYFLFREGKLVYKQRCAYFKGFWNWVETILVFSEFATIILFLARLYEVDRNLLQLRENPNDYVGFQYAGSADAALCTVLGVLVFFYTLRFLRLLRFNKNFLIIGKTFARISSPILSFCLPFFFGFMAFGMFAFTIFGAELQDYSTFTMTMVTQFSMTLGDFDFEALVMVDPVLGAVYFFGFVGLNVFILMNMFLAIINDSYAEVQEEEKDAENEYEVLDYVVEKLQTTFKKKSAKKSKVAPKKMKRKSKEKPHYVSFKESNEKALSSFNETCLLELESREKRLDNLLNVINEGEKSELMNEHALVAMPKDKQNDGCFRIILAMESVPFEITEEDVAVEEKFD